MINLNVTKEDRGKIHLIVQRARRLVKGLKLDQVSLEMDLSAVHLNDGGLDLDRLLIADSFSLLHDVLGIQKYLDRQTGLLGNCFVPRFFSKEPRA